MNYPLTPSNQVLDQYDLINAHGDEFWADYDLPLPPSASVDDEFSSAFYEENDYSAVTLKFISDMLMDEEDDLENIPFTHHDSLALQATEKSLYDALHDDNRDNDDDPLRISLQVAEQEIETEIEPLELYDNVLLSSDTNPPPTQTCNHHSNGRGRKTEVAFIKEFVDLGSLLLKCAEVLTNLDTDTAIHLLLEIRLHSSPQGNSMERVAHYFANALEARLAGTGIRSYAEINLDRISPVKILKSYKTYTTACPFFKISILLANKTIGKLAKGATTLHIIDFGTLCGFQWPSLIQILSERHGGPPKLRITGIETPQTGHRPAERVEKTGRRLATYCNRFGVPFEFNAIAQKWETIRVEDLKIKKDELLVVNCLNRLHNLWDETVNVCNPRDSVLKLIKNMNPDMFINVISNGQYNTPFFLTRFREALFHFSNRFDMFEATVPPEDEGRRIFEEYLFGKEAMNIIACEGTQRIERPETYKMWQLRMLKAGFRQLPLDPEIMKYVKSKVKAEYHKSFSVDEDEKWMLHGWKGRIIHAFSCWQPARNRSIRDPPFSFDQISNVDVSDSRKNSSC